MGCGLPSTNHKYAEHVSLAGKEDRRRQDATKNRLILARWTKHSNNCGCCAVETTQDRSAVDLLLHGPSPRTATRLSWKARGLWCYRWSGMMLTGWDSSNAPVWTLFCFCVEPNEQMNYILLCRRTRCAVLVGVCCWLPRTCTEDIMDIYIPVSVIRLSLIINSLYDFLTVRVDLNNNNNNNTYS